MPEIMAPIMQASRQRLLLPGAAAGDLQLLDPRHQPGPGQAGSANANNNNNNNNGRRLRQAAAAPAGSAGQCNQLAYYAPCGRLTCSLALHAADLCSRTWAHTGLSPSPTNLAPCQRCFGTKLSVCVVQGFRM